VIAYKGEAASFEIPAELYAPIRQDAVLLKRASGNAAARGFLVFLRGADALRVIQSFGYGPGPVDPPPSR